MKTYIQVKKLHPDAIIPKYATSGAAGLDITSIENHTFAPYEQKVIKTGLSVAIPEGFELQVRPRSGLAAKERIMVSNSPGTLDSDFRGEVGIILLNNKDKNWTVNKGDRIAQLVLSTVPIAEFVEVDDLSETDRGAGGFGSTGKT